jgi:hypothetical protein
MASNTVTDRLLSLVYSAALGGVLGCVCGIGLGIGWESFTLGLLLGSYGAVGGLFIGLFMGPVLDFALKRHATARDVWTIGVSTGLIALAGGVGGGHFNRPLTATVSTVLAYFILCGIVGVRADRRWCRLHDPSRCRGCGYFIVGLKEARCPECGMFLPKKNAADAASE